jgi:hypothetical protein
MGWVVNTTSRPLYPREGLGAYYIGGLGGCGKSRPTPGIDSGSVQPVESRYTD